MTNETLEQRADRICDFRLSFKEFARNCLGYKDMNNIHDDLCDFLQNDDSKFKLILKPRFSFKSCICTVGWSLWRLMGDHDMRILIYSDAATKAVGFLNSIKSQIEGKVANSVFREYMPDWETDPRNGKWSESQILISVRKTSFSEPTIDTGGIETSKIGFHYDIIIFDDIVSDMNVTTKAQMDKVVDCYSRSLSLLKPGGEVIMVGCLVAGSKVTMANGIQKPIEMVKVGEKVISYKYDREHSVETVEAMIPQGKADVYELKTANHTIQATSNHPFLTKDGFKKLSELKKYDQIYTLSYLPRIRKTDFTPEEMWLLGFMFGDGWITEHPNSKGSMRWVTCFAKSVDEDLNREVKTFLESEFNFKFKLTKGGYYRTEKASVAKYLINLGFKGKAKTKRIPTYVFGLSVKYREAFLRGFLDADGWIDAFLLKHTELCNINLVEDLKLLAETCGYKVSNIHSRQRISKPPNSKEYFVSESHHISIGNKKTKKRFKLESINSIKHIGKKEVFDLTVSNTHNFIAEGYVVHNTRWHFGDLYGRIIAENDQKNIFKIFIVDGEEDKKYGSYCYKDIGLTKNFLEHQKKQQGTYIYSCLYRNNPVDPETAIFKSSDFSFYGGIKSEDLYMTCTIDPAGEGKDFTAFTVVGTDHEMTMNIFEVIQKHMPPSEIIETLANLHYKYKFKMVGIETIFFRRMLRLELERIRQEKHTDNPQAFPMFGIMEFDSSSRHGKSKFARIMGLQPYHERGAIKFPGEKLELLTDGFSTLAHQMLEFTPTHMPEPNDALDSLADHIPLARKGGVVKKKELPRNSPAWLERKIWEREIKKMANLPRRWRRPLIPLSFS